MNVLLPIENDAIEWLQNYIKSNMVAFEYGSGNSTIYFGNRLSAVVSVEHSSETFYNYEEKVKKFKSGFIYQLIEPEEDPKSYPYSHESYGSTDTNYLYHNFKDYVNYIKEFNDHTFDIILINGRSRASCIMTAVQKVRKGGILILNNSERYVYQDAKKLFLNKYPVNLFGKKIRKTSIYEIK